MQMTASFHQVRCRRNWRQFSSNVFKSVCVSFSSRKSNCQLARGLYEFSDTTLSSMNKLIRLEYQTSPKGDFEKYVPSWEECRSPFKKNPKFPTEPTHPSNVKFTQSSFIQLPYAASLRNHCKESRAKRESYGEPYRLAEEKGGNNAVDTSTAVRWITSSFIIQRP